MKKQVKLSNNSESWDSNRRYKVNALVTYNGTEWQNTTGINSEPTLTSNNWIKVGSTTSYQVYTALLTQVGTAAPSAIISENTIGNIIWTRSGAGVYYATLLDAFTNNKTYMFYGKSGICFILHNTFDTDTIHLFTTDTIVGPNDGLLVNTPIEIRVYN